MVKSTPNFLSTLKKFAIAKILPICHIQNSNGLIGSSNVRKVEKALTIEENDLKEAHHRHQGEVIIHEDHAHTREHNQVVTNQDLALVGKSHET